MAGVCSGGLMAIGGVLAWQWHKDDPSDKNF